MMQNVEEKQNSDHVNDANVDDCSLTHSSSEIGLGQYQQNSIMELSNSEDEASVRSSLGLNFVTQVCESGLAWKG